MDSQKQYINLDQYLNQPILCPDLTPQAATPDEEETEPDEKEKEAQGTTPSVPQAIANLGEEELQRLQSMGERPRLILRQSTSADHVEDAEDTPQTPVQQMTVTVCPPAPERDTFLIVRSIRNNSAQSADPVPIRPLRSFTTARQLLFEGLSKSTDSLDSLPQSRQWKAPRLVPHTENPGAESARSRKVLGTNSFEIRRLQEEARVYQSYPC